MQSFNLKIITPNGTKFDGEAQGVLVRSVVGDLTILARHIDYVTALGVGKATITTSEGKKIGACNSGVLSMLKGEVTILASTFEWHHEIDLDRAQESLKRHKELLTKTEDAKQIELAKLKIERALTRIDVKGSI